MKLQIKHDGSEIWHDFYENFVQYNFDKPINCVFRVMKDDGTIWLGPDNLYTDFDKAVDALHQARRLYGTK